MVAIHTKNEKGRQALLAGLTLPWRLSKALWSLTERRSTWALLASVR